MGTLSRIVEEHMGLGARRNDPETSHEAAEAMEHKPGLQDAICEALAEHNGLTSLELAQILEIGPQTTSPAMVILERKGRVHRIELSRVDGFDPAKRTRKSKRYLTRKNSTGASAIVWFLTGKTDA